MMKLGMLTMILGVLSTLSSTLFTVIYQQYNTMLLLTYWGLLSGFEFFFAWVYLPTKPKASQYTPIVAVAALVALTIVWIILVFNNADANLIFAWALKILNYSSLYFVGLFIYYRENKNSRND